MPSLPLLAIAQTMPGSRITIRKPGFRLRFSLLWEREWAGII